MLTGRTLCLVLQWRVWTIPKLLPRQSPTAVRKMNSGMRKCTVRDGVPFRPTILAIFEEATPPPPWRMLKVWRLLSPQTIVIHTSLCLDSILMSPFSLFLCCFLLLSLFCFLPSAVAFSLYLSLYVTFLLSFSLLLSSPLCSCLRIECICRSSFCHSSSLSHTQAHAFLHVHFTPYLSMLLWKQERSGLVGELL